MTQAINRLAKLTLIEGQPSAIKMSAEQKTAWLSALRSGEYEQAVGSLRVDRGVETPGKYGYCCLGVLEQVISGEVEEFHNGQAIGLPTKQWCLDHGIEVNPKSIQVGSADPTILVLVSSYDHPDEEREIRVSTLNDDGYTFEEIADLIEPLIEVV